MDRKDILERELEEMNELNIDNMLGRKQIAEEIIALTGSEGKS